MALCRRVLELPESFLHLAVESLGQDAVDKFLSAFDEPQKISIRFNIEKYDIERFKSSPLAPYKEILWCKEALLLENRPNFTLDPVFNAGGYYVQDSSCMFLSIIWNNLFKSQIMNGVRVLDLCAAPGGKTTHLSSLLNSSAGFGNYFIVANETIRQRSAILAENISKWGDPNIAVTSSDPSSFSQLHNFFDIILVDAPCSGEGMFRKSENAMEEWSLQNVNLCASRQKRILNEVWDSLRRGGIIIYSTCTFNHLENDDNLRYIRDHLGGTLVKIDNDQIKSFGVIATPEGGYQFIPGVVAGEGQYFCIICKGGEFDETSFTQYNYKRSSAGKQDLRRRIIEKKRGDLIKIHTESVEECFDVLSKKLNIISSGTAVGTLKGRDFIPHADLALSSCVADFSEYLNNRYKFKYISLEVDKKTALTFLSKGQLSLDISNAVPNGYIILIYNNIALGFVKNLGNRINSLHPNSRRIRMSIPPIV